MTEPAPWYLARGFVWSATFLVLLGVVAVAVALSGGDDRAAVTTAATVKRPAGALVDTGGSRCGLPVGPTDKPVGPPDATWKLVGTVAVPSSPTFGPGIDQGWRRVCFAHSPTGALFAAASFLATSTNPRLTVDGAREILAETHARNVLLKQNAEPHDPFVRSQVAGFRVTVASRDLVIVDLALQTNIGGGGLAAVSMPMRWEQRPKEGGDWRLMVTDVDEPYSGAVIDDLSDYVRWAGA